MLGQPIDLVAGCLTERPLGIAYGPAAALGSLTGTSDAPLDCRKPITRDKRLFAVLARDDGDVLYAAVEP